MLSAEHTLWCRHEADLTNSTTIADVVALRDRLGLDADGALCRLSTLCSDAELGSLRARQIFPGRSRSLDGRFGVARFADAIALAQGESLRRGRTISLVPEMKTPAWFGAQGIDPLLALAQFDWSGPMLLQCFDHTWLMLAKQQLRCTTMALFEQLPVIAQWATGHDWLGLPSAAVLDENGDDLGTIGRAHDAGQRVAVWTVRFERVPAAFSSYAQFVQRLAEIGADALFCDQPDLAIKALVAVSA